MVMSSPQSPTTASSPGVSISPSRRARDMRTASPARALSPTLSIFERDVQDTASIPASPGIPAHIKTENFIPPVLNDASDALTSDLDPENIAIVAAPHRMSIVPLASSSSLSLLAAPSAVASASSALADLMPHCGDDQVSTADAVSLSEAASQVDSLETPPDMRRLSFISFADVMQSEHMMSNPLFVPTNLAAATTSSAPTSQSASVRDDLSLARKPNTRPSSPQLYHYTLTSNSGREGGISVETMAQALRRTASADLTTSAPASPLEMHHPLR